MGWNSRGENRRMGIWRRMRYHIITSTQLCFNSMIQELQNVRRRYWLHSDRSQQCWLISSAYCHSRKHWEQTPNLCCDINITKHMMRYCKRKSHWCGTSGHLCSALLFPQFRPKWALHFRVCDLLPCWYIIIITETAGYSRKNRWKI